MIYDNVVETDFTGDIKKVITESKNELTAKAIILCAGATPRKLGLIKEDKFIGRGVSYCAVCDGAFYKNKNVVVVGGGNTAVSDCMYLSKFATAVHLVHRRDKLRASKVEINKLVNSGVVIHYNSVVTDIIGEDKVTAVKLQNVIDKSESNIEIDGIFVAIGQIPSNIASEVERDDYGYIIANEDMKTNIEGVFVAGDVRSKKVRQVITAASDGAIAAEMANEYILNKYEIK